MSYKPFIKPNIMPELVYWYGASLNILVQQFDTLITQNITIDWDHYSLDTEKDEIKEGTEDIDRLIYETLAQRMLQLWLTFIELRPEGGKREDHILDLASKWEGYIWIYF
jgi:hypothetical protein